MLTVGSLAGVLGYGRPAPSTGGNAPSSGASILAFARTLAAAFPSGTVAPTGGGALTINGLSAGSYEYAIRPGETVSSSWNEANYFSSTEDSVSSWIIFNGNVTVDASFTSGAPLRPTKRKLFTVVYVTGNLTMNGVLSMTARGANHSATPAINIRLANGSYSQTSPTVVTITDPQIPASGGAGAASRSTTGANTGTAGSSGGTGGGGGGYFFSSPVGSSVGTGSAGTCFSGGSGSGSTYVSQVRSSENAGSNGGTGSAGANPDAQIGSGGAGNPGGLGYWIGASPPSYLYPTINGESGTGGVLIVIVEGTLSSSVGGATRFTANGSNGGTLGGVSGGGSGGGSVNIFYKTLGTAPGITASAGNGAGAGTARRFALP